jgi:hypothetical protein
MMGLVSEQICQLRFERRTAMRKSDYVRMSANTAETKAKDQTEDKRALENCPIPERRMHS